MKDFVNYMVRDNAFRLSILAILVIGLIYSLASCEMIDPPGPVTATVMKSLEPGNKDTEYKYLSDKAKEVEITPEIPVARFKFAKVGTDASFLTLSADAMTTIRRMTHAYIQAQTGCEIADINPYDDPGYSDYPFIVDSPCPPSCDEWILVYNTGDTKGNPADRQLIYLVYPYYLCDQVNDPRYVFMCFNPSGGFASMDAANLIIYQSIPDEPPEYMTGASLWLTAKSGYVTYKMKGMRE